MDHVLRAACARVISAGVCLFALTASPALVRGAVDVRAHIAAAAPAVHISGNHLVDGSGRTLRLLGVNRSGAEYACVQGWGIFDGPADATSIGAMATWHVDAVRLPLNEDCWLGINGVPASYSGVSYQQAIQQYVSLLHQAGMVVILDLHWAAPGATPATGQLPMADADHAPAFWSSVAATFKTDPSVVYDLFNEPFLDTGNAATLDPWTCWLEGCTVNAGNGVGHAWQSAGMQQLVDAVRATGATQPVMAGGLAWSNDLSQWLAHRPADPAGQLAASFHEYNFNSCSAPACWTAEIAPVAQLVPVITGEVGENDCGGSFIDQYLPWADSVGISYLAWTWDTWDCSSGPALITSYAGTPTAYGAAYKAHLATLTPRGPAGGLVRAGPSPAPTLLQSVVPVSVPAALRGDVVEQGVLPAQHHVVEAGGHLHPPQISGWLHR